MENRRELIPIKPAYHDYTKWMWRYYITRPHPNTALMSETSRTNWNACDAVYKTLSEPDRKLISEYAVQIAHDFTFAGMYADKNKMTSYNVLNRIKYIFRQTAIKRGLWEYWDHDRMERTEQNTTGKAEQHRDDRAGANGEAEAERNETNTKAEEQTTHVFGKAEHSYYNHNTAYTSGTIEQG